MSHAALYRSRICPADFVVITGPGPIGLTLLQIVKLFNPRAVMVTGLKDDTVRLQRPGSWVPSMCTIARMTR